MESLTIKYKTRSADVDDILKHLTGCKDNFIPRLDQTVDIPEYAKKIAQHAVTFEAWSGKELIGLIAAYFNDAQSRSGFITNVSVMKEFAGKGIASQLVKDCIRFAKEQKFNQVSLEVNENNQPAIKLYKKHNFTGTALKGNVKRMSLVLKD